MLFLNYCSKFVRCTFYVLSFFLNLFIFIVKQLVNPNSTNINPKITEINTKSSSQTDNEDDCFDLSRLKLSRPLNKIIEDTFNEEISKLNSPIVEVRLRKTIDLNSNQPKKSIIKRNKVKNVLTNQNNKMLPQIKEVVKDSEQNSIDDDHKEIMVNSKAEEQSRQIRVLTLNNKEHQNSTLYRLKKNWTIQFCLGPSLFGKKVYLHCNYPDQDQQKYERHKYYLLTWGSEFDCENSDDTALMCCINVKIPGSFHYYFVFDESESKEIMGSGFFLVDPEIRYGKDEILPLDCIQCQTVLSKNLGLFNTWEGKLKVTKNSGYNMIHFTPLQELGKSNSAYSISDQLKINPIFSTKNQEVTYDDIESLMLTVRMDWKMSSICDIVLNHTANETPWLVEHPEATYNTENCAYLKPAYLLDVALNFFSVDIKNGIYENQGIPSLVNSEDHLNAIRYYLHQNVFNKIKLHEMYICNVPELVKEFTLRMKTNTPFKCNAFKDLELDIIQDPCFKRLKCTIDFNIALKMFNTFRNDCFDEDSRSRKCTEEFKKKLDELNSVIIDKLQNNANSAVENCIANVRYFRVQEDGPKFTEISDEQPLWSRYFTDYGVISSIEECEITLHSSNAKYLMAHNGWVMNSDPLHNFAENSDVYLRRELIAWGDSVKLRYGEKPSDSPFLWKLMTEYVVKTAQIFDGVRLDNCHSTPIPVAEYLLDCARKEKPDLFIVAELFTNSDEKDNIFVNRLGITSLIREAMSAWDPHELGRLVYRYGGDPVGAFYQPNMRPIAPSIAHALFLDLTHDNPSPIEKRSVYDLLPSAALVNMACCATGSSRGYDELVPHHIHVVEETREYKEWKESDEMESEFVTQFTGIINAKRRLNEVHCFMGYQGFDQIFVDQIHPAVTAVTRHNPKTHESFIMIAFNAFNFPIKNEDQLWHNIKPLKIEGHLDSIVLEAFLKHKDERFKQTENFSKDNRYINGYNDYAVELKENIDINASDMIVAEFADPILQVNFKNFKPGSIILLKVSVHKNVENSLKTLKDVFTKFNKENEVIQNIISSLNLAGLNKALYRCHEEDHNESEFGAYNIPNYGPTVYCGLQGIISILSNVRPKNDLGHPLCENIRNGNWLIEYIANRLKVDPLTKDLGNWIEENSKELRNLPRYLAPSYFDIFITRLYTKLLEQCFKLMGKFVRNGSSFVRFLALGSVQCGAIIKSSPLPMLSPNLKPPTPSYITENGEVKIQACVTLSAGLPHFTTGYTRNWGRDTFIALRGLFLLTGRYDEARYLILGYAATLRHGLIPNLLDGGKNARYNCRDAFWWWMYSIKSFVEEVPNGEYILSDKVSRLFPNDDSEPEPPGKVDQPLYDVVQEGLTKHFQGMDFRERNAGSKIDEHMTDKGFNIQIGVHPETGFVFGGNIFNCGTWMDKMGSSEKAGNKGKPATPRDGSAVELIGLSKTAISWLNAMNKDGKYPYNCVERIHNNGKVTKWTFEEWSKLINMHFETHFWINLQPSTNETRPDLINRRGIYKDCYGASQEWTDYQLRCNFPITMVTAPELFNPENAWHSLMAAEKYLLGPLGMKTLDPSDWNYSANYDNSNDSNENKIAHGFNYHQGPEWVWPIGYFLRAKLIFGEKLGKLEETIALVKHILSAHFIELQISPWKGLPELTDENGGYCHHSSKTQAWSMSSVLEVLYDLQTYENILKNN